MLFQMIVQAKDWLRRKEEGQGLVEYALILVFIAILVIAVLVLLGPEVADIYQQILDALTSAPVAP